MRKETPFTLDEAKAYIIESITTWDVPGQNDKIIKMAGYAYNRRNKKATVSGAAKLKSINKDIKSMELVIRRAKERGDDYTVADVVLGNLMTERDELSATITLKEPKKPKK